MRITSIISSAGGRCVVHFDSGDRMSVPASVLHDPVRLADTTWMQFHQPLADRYDIGTTGPARWREHIAKLKAAGEKQAAISRGRRR